MAPGISKIPDDAKINHIYPITYAPDVEALAFVKLVQEPADVMKPTRKGVACEVMMIIGDGMWESEDVVKV